MSGSIVNAVIICVLGLAPSIWFKIGISIGLTVPEPGIVFEE